MTAEIKLGDRVQHKVSKSEGVVVAVTTFLHTEPAAIVMCDFGGLGRYSKPDEYHCALGWLEHVPAKEASKA